MNEFIGYENLQEISKSTNSRIYRGTHVENNQNVIIKVFNKENPSEDDILKFNREYDLLSLSQAKGIIEVYEKTTIDNSPAIVMEDIKGVSLKNILTTMKLSIEEFLKLAIEIVDAIGIIHSLNIIHKDINPSNIIWNIEDNNIKIIDFGIATKLSREITSVKNPNILEGTLAYISPEQTGRMNRSLDYRSDFYSLGITFYWMLCSKVPFESDDLLKLVHSHIAVKPDSPREFDHNIPQALSDIVMKLIAKNAEDRYLSTNGLKVDLEKCLDDLLRSGAIEPFELGTLDISEKFELSQKLYGREKEIDSLLKAFERVSPGNTEIMLVSGFGGIGKSALINEIQRPIVKHRGYFLSGKFEQLKRDVPYSAITQALTFLGKQILGENETEIAIWKNKIMTAVGYNGKIITEIVPIFELVIGKQEELSELGPHETRNRFHQVFESFIKAIANKDHPIVLFLDDLQWADSASLQVIRLLTTVAEIKYLFIIGAYRHNEIAESHPLSLVINDIENSGITVNNIFLQPLDHVNIVALLNDTFKNPQEDVDNLAEIIVKKTGGNPFFVNEFIKFLYKESIVEFALKKGWFWSIEKISEMKATDNVIDLIAGKIVELTTETQEVIKVASCLGNNFTLENLDAVSEKSKDQITDALDEAIDSEMINFIDDTYYFNHDRVLEAAYSLMSNEERMKYHYTIGNLELQKMSLEDQEDNVFYIVNHLNTSIALIDSEVEKVQLQRLNCTAGKKALASNAYEEALNYLKIGISLLNNESWQNKYILTLELYQEAAAAANLCGEYEQMSSYSNEVIQNAGTLLDKIKTYEIMVHSLNSQNKIIESLRLAIDVLEKLGVKFPENPTMLRVIFELISVKILLWRKSIETLIDLPKMVDPRKLAITNLIPIISAAAYTTSPDIIPLLISYTIKLSFKNGMSIYLPFASASLGMIHCSIFGEIDAGYKYGLSALQLIEKTENDKNKAGSLFIFWCFISHWKKPIRNSLQPYLDIYKIALDSGDNMFATVSVNAYACNMFYAGIELNKVERAFAKYVDIIEVKHITVLNLHLLQHQAVLNLLGKSEDPTVLIGSSYDIATMLPVHEKANDASALFAVYYFKMNLNYIFGKYEESLNDIDEAQKYIGSVLSSPYIPLLYYYDSLIRLSLYDERKRSIKRKYLKKIKKNQKKLKKWAHHSPENYKHKYFLVVAELASIKKNNKRARKYYDLAIEYAKEHLFLQEEALAHELYGKFWLKNNNDKVASVFMTDAYNLYRKWGALAKVKHLEENYNELIGSRPTIKHSFDSTRTSTNTTNSTESIDLSTIMQTSQTLSSEIDLHKLLEKVMALSIENAGAQRGFLILENNEDKFLYIEAQGETDKESTVLNSVPVDQNNNLSISIINYVNRTGENLVLNNACKEGDFIDDSYIKENEVKSLLCIPVSHKGKTSGILYLENNLTSNVFTQDRIELLQLISSQAAISIENAQLLLDKEKALDIQTNMAKSFSRFVPMEFLTFLNKKSIVEVELGNQVQKQMTVLFSDIRSFTTLSEKMTPQENFNFLNSYLKRIGPIIRSHGGFIDKYIGDAVMALFPGDPEDALNAAIMMQNDTIEYNNYRRTMGYDNITVGIGLHYGNLMLGTIGEENRMEGTVISDDVNLSSRIESLTKYYGSEILISGTLFNKLSDKTRFTYRIIDTVIVKGRSEPVTLIEIFDENICETCDFKVSTKKSFIQGLKLYRNGSIEDALRIFEELSDVSLRGDHVFEIYIDRCKELLLKGIPEGWNGIERFEEK